MDIIWQDVEQESFSCCSCGLCCVLCGAYELCDVLLHVCDGCRVVRFPGSIIWKNLGLRGSYITSIFIAIRRSVKQHSLASCFGYSHRDAGSQFGTVWPNLVPELWY